MIPLPRRMIAAAVKAIRNATNDAWGVNIAGGRR